MNTVCGLLCSYSNPMKNNIKHPKVTIPTIKYLLLILKQRLPQELYCHFFIYYNDFNRYLLPFTNSKGHNIFISLRFI